MDPSSESYVNLEQLDHLSTDLSAYSSPLHECALGLPFHLHEPPMEFMDGSLEYHKTANRDGLRIGQDSPADSGYGVGSDIPSYLNLPIDPGYQHACSPESYNEAFQKPQAGARDKKHEVDKIHKGDNGRSFATHSRRSSRSSNKLTSDESGIDKRERNRMAASKCRKKQKLANTELQERARIMSEQHNYLIAHKASLESEMIGLKNELLLHGSCGCEPITDYLMQAARKFVKGREEEAFGLEKSENARERPPSAAREPCML